VTLPVLSLAWDKHVLCIPPQFCPRSFVYALRRYHGQLCKVPNLSGAVQAYEHAWCCCSSNSLIPMQWHFKQPRCNAATGTTAWSRTFLVDGPVSYKDMKPACNDITVGSSLISCMTCMTSHNDDDTMKQLLLPLRSESYQSHSKVLMSHCHQPCLKPVTHLLSHCFTGSTQLSAPCL